MKKLFNSIETMVDDMLDGFVSAYPQVQRGNLDPRIVVRGTNRKNADEKVTLLIGNGSGHEPIAMGFVGQGMLDANVVGDVFRGTLCRLNSRWHRGSFRLCRNTAAYLATLRRHDQRARGYDDGAG